MTKKEYEDGVRKIMCHDGFRANYGDNNRLAAEISFEMTYFIDLEVIEGLLRHTGQMERADEMARKRKNFINNVFEDDNESSDGCGAEVEGAAKEAPTQEG